jgi:RNA polymerase sigma-70 factor (ECF subfamily)
MDVAVLLDRCRQGDQLAWEALVRQYQGRVYAVAYHYVGNAEDARDLTQEVFVKLYRTVDGVEADLLLSWIVRVARNACIDFLRRRRARPAQSEESLEEMEHLSTPLPDPEEQWQAGSRRRLIHRAMRGLSLLNREMIILREIQGLSLEEIASLLGVPLGTVKSRCNRARIELADKVLALSADGGS